MTLVVPLGIRATLRFSGGPNSPSSMTFTVLRPSTLSVTQAFVALFADFVIWMVGGDPLTNYTASMSASYTWSKLELRSLDPGIQLVEVIPAGFSGQIPDFTYAPLPAGEPAIGLWSTGMGTRRRGRTYFVGLSSFVQFPGGGADNLGLAGKAVVQATQRALLSALAVNGPFQLVHLVSGGAYGTAVAPTALSVVDADPPYDLFGSQRRRLRRGK